MNDLLELNGVLNSSPFTGKIIPSLPKDKIIKSSNIDKFASQLEKLYGFWSEKKLIDGALISVYYNRIIPKSGRIERLLSLGSEKSNNYVRGVRFDSTGNKHIITYYIKLPTLKIIINRFRIISNIVQEICSGSVSKDNFKLIDDGQKLIENKYKMSKSEVKILIRDFLDIEKFDVFRNLDVNLEKSGYITLFATDKNIEQIMNDLNIPNTDYSLFDTDTIYTGNNSVLSKIKSEADYLISMTMPDLAKYDNEEFNRIDPLFDFSSFPKPSNEPTIGVIDTLYSENVYFNEWVDYQDLVSNDIEKTAESYRHGTEVDSIIVDGGHINPQWNDNCGNFKVRHFGVAIDGDNNSFVIISKIKTIIEKNLDIKVWNISLGSIYDTQLYTISPEAAALDELQNKYNIVFIVSGTNISNSNPSAVRIGAPADSINSIVVNSVDKNGDIPSYARKGKVLSFFIKPDICAFGGDKNGYINVCNSTGLGKVAGTSYAAPWIARKMSYLIDKLGLSREIAKALIIDSGLNFSKINHDMEYLGYGIVPTKIEEVLYGKNDEIKFFIEGFSTSYNTYTYKIPVPIVDKKYPYNARAVMCYFPKCTRNQGVDYTNTELNISFGRMYDKGIKSINNNIQDSEVQGMTTEKEARDIFRKWDNVKIALDETKNTKVPRDTFGKETWGLKVTNKGRIGLESDIRFGVVITLKEMYGKNRISEFINKCELNGWLVNKINIDNQLDIYVSAEEELEFE